jgi:pilus assembly protein CpaB
MSSALRLSVILVLVFATAVLGLLAYNASQPNAPAPVAQQSPAPTIGYLAAAHTLPAGTLARDEDFAARPGVGPSGAIVDTPEARAELRGSLVRRFLDANAAITSDDVLRPRDRGFLASVLAPDTRAVSIKVDAESGVSGLIWPGDRVDVVLTQVNDKTDAAHRTLSETVLHNVRIIAIDQDIVQGAKDIKDNGAAAAKDTRAVSLELWPEQVKAIAVAKDLGKLSLAVRAAEERRKTEESATMFGCDVSPEIARQTAIASQTAAVVVYAGGKPQEFSVRKHDADAHVAVIGCDTSSRMAGEGATVASGQ